MKKISETLISNAYSDDQIGISITVPCNLLVSSSILPVCDEKSLRSLTNILTINVWKINGLNDKRVHNSYSTERAEISLVRNFSSPKRLQQTRYPWDTRFYGVTLALVFL
jgi:hypothetical protein